MSDLKKIKSALISVYHKERVDEIVSKLKELGIIIYSTGGTKKFIEELGVSVTAVEELTTYPSILGGWVLLLLIFIRLKVLLLQGLPKMK